MGINVFVRVFLKHVMSCNYKYDSSMATKQRLSHDFCKCSLSFGHERFK